MSKAKIIAAPNVRTIGETSIGISYRRNHRPMESKGILSTACGTAIELPYGTMRHLITDMQTIVDAMDAHMDQWKRKQEQWHSQNPASTAENQPATQPDATPANHQTTPAASHTGNAATTHAGTDSPNEHDNYNPSAQTAAQPTISHSTTSPEHGNEPKPENVSAWAQTLKSYVERATPNEAHAENS